MAGRNENWPRFLRRRRERFEARAVVAAASRIQITERKTADRIKKNRQNWQEQGWNYYDELGEVKYAVNYRGNVMSRVALYAAEAPEGDEEPPETNDQRAIDALARLATNGSHAELLRKATINLSVPGEYYLIGVNPEADGTAGGLASEHWDVRSIDEIEIDASGRIVVKDVPGVDKPYVLTDNDYLARCWMAHPRKRNLADSSLRGVLDSCEDLRLLGMAARAAVRARISAGLLLVPDELDFGATDPTTSNAGDGQPRLDPFDKDVTDAMMEAISDPTAASAVMPSVIRGKGEHLKMITHMTFDRPLDKVIDVRTERALRRLAQGLDVPVEIVLGIGDLNHWSAWFIGDDAFQNHIEPMLTNIVDSWTAEYLHPALEAADMSAEEARRFRIWYNPARAITRPDQSENAKWAYDKFILSDEAVARMLNLSSDDRPNDEEIRRRLAQLGITRVDSSVQAQLLQDTVAPDIELPASSTPVSGGTDAVPQQQVTGNGPPPMTPPVQQAPAVAASAVLPLRPEPVAFVRRRARMNLGHRLLGIDQTLRSRLHIATDAAVTRALERTGNQLRSKAQRDTTLRAALKDVAPAHVAFTLGRNVVQTFAVDEHDLIASSFTALGQQFRRWTTKAATDTVDALDLTGVAATTAMARYERDIGAAWDWLSAAVAKLATERLYDPSPEAPALGEFDSSLNVPVSMLRAALGIAGGTSDIERLDEGGAVVRIDQTVVGGIATGQIVDELLSDRGDEIEGYEWVYGEFMRTHPFEPHEELDGVQFQNFDDEVLANPEPFPEYPYYIPGDHEGCFPAGTIVSGPGARGATLRKYEGIMVDVSFASGQKLSATGNHPILTRRGWVGAQFLEEGDEVVRCSDAQGIARLIPDNHQVPTPIQDVVRALDEVRGMVAARVPIAPEQFHGDGIGSEVGVVWTDSLLRDDAETGRDDLLGKPALGTVQRAGAFAAQSHSDTLLDGFSSPAFGGVGGQGVDLALLRRQSAVPQVLGSRSIAQNDAASQTLVDGVAINAEALGKSQDALTGFVEFDKVIGIEAYTFSGDVYNLQTTTGWYIAEGVIVHNCQCDLMPIIISASREQAG